jgi:flagellar assembly protein FliH
MSGWQRALEQPTGRICDQVQIFEYPSCGAAPAVEWNGWVEAGDVAAIANDWEMGNGDGEARGDGKQSEEGGRGFEAGRARGREEGRNLEREAQVAARKNEEEGCKRQLARLVAEFSGARDRFLEAVEPEVVKLALAVAARILRREAQMDPLLLTGAVRVALGQLAGTTEVQLKVPVAQIELWREAIGLIPNLAVKPAVVAGAGMRIGDCAIESKVGTVDLGVRSQLGEIERGFFDCAAAARDEAKSPGGRNAVENEVRA